MDLPIQPPRAIPLRIWDRIGRVPLRTKIFGIVLIATCSTGIGVIFWMNIWLGHVHQPDISSDVLTELIVTGAIAASISLIVAWLLTNVLIHQIQQVTRAAQQVQGGDLSQRAPVWARDDIGALALAFNAMIDSVAHSKNALEQSNTQLAARNDELTTLYDLALLATRAAQLETLLGRALEKITEISEAEASAILLAGEDGKFCVRASIRFPAAVRAALERITTDDPLFQQAAALSQPLSWPPAGGETNGVSRLHALGAACGLGQAWAIPLQSHRSVTGLVVLFQSAGPTIAFDAINLSFIQALSNEISLAVENANLWAEISRKEAMRARLLARVVTAQEQERERISRELHDETGQSLTALLVQLRLFEHLSDRDTMLAHAAEVRALVLDTLEEVRRLARDLRPGTLDELGLVPTIEWHVRTFTRNSDLQVDFEADVPEEFRLPRHTEIALYRVVQEALTNIARHAQAAHVSIRLHEKRGTLSLTIQDDGCGFDVSAVMQSGERGLGLHGIQERVELIGGALILRSAAGEGTLLNVEVPMLEKVQAEWPR